MKIKKILSLLLVLSSLFCLNAQENDLAISRLSSFLIGNWKIENFNHGKSAKQGEIYFHVNRSVTLSGGLATLKLSKHIDALPKITFQVKTSRVLVLSAEYADGKSVESAMLLYQDSGNMMTLVSGEKMSILTRSKNEKKSHKIVRKNNPNREPVKSTEAPKKEPKKTGGFFSKFIKSNKEAAANKLINLRISSRKKQVTLFWDTHKSLSGVTSYKFYRKRSPDDYDLIGSAKASERQYIDVPRQHGVYHYKIEAYQGEKVIAEETVRYIVR